MVACTSYTWVRRLSDRASCGTLVHTFPYASYSSSWVSSGSFTGHLLGLWLPISGMPEGLGWGS